MKKLRWLSVALIFALALPIQADDAAKVFHELQRGPGGTAAQPTYSFQAATGTGFYLIPGTSQVGLSIAGTNVLTVTSSGLSGVISSLTASRIVLSDSTGALTSNGAITTNAVPKSASSGASLAASSISDNGTTVTLTATDLAVGGGDIDAGASGTAGTVDIFPTTAAKGKLQITAADNTGDTTTSVTVAAQAGAATYTIPDAGTGSFVMTTGSSTISGTKTFSADPRTSVGVGAVNGAGVSLVENGDGALHKTVFTLASASVTMTDAGAAGSQGSLKIYDLPEGVIQHIGCSYNLTTLAGAGGIADGAALVGSLGTVAAAVDNATLTGTEADLIASTTGTLTAGAGVLGLHGSAVVPAYDGHTTAVDYILNLAVPDADSSANDTVAVSGTVTCVWSNLGDY